MAHPTNLLCACAVAPFYQTARMFHLFHSCCSLEEAEEAVKRPVVQVCCVMGSWVVVGGGICRYVCASQVTEKNCLPWMVSQLHMSPALCTVSQRSCPCCVTAVTPTPTCCIAGAAQAVSFPQLPPSLQGQGVHRRQHTTTPAGRFFWWAGFGSVLAPLPKFYCLSSRHHVCSQPLPMTVCCCCCCLVAFMFRNSCTHTNAAAAGGLVPGFTPPCHPEG